jgi:hypothetical protein
MRNRNIIDPAVFNHLIGSEAETQLGASRFRVSGGTNPLTIEVPTPVVYRMFLLGQAYDSRQLRNLAPGVKVVIGSVDIAAFTRDLRQLLVLVNDELLHHYVNALLAALEASPGISGKSVAVSVGGFDEKRA